MLGVRGAIEVGAGCAVWERQVPAVMRIVGRGDENAAVCARNVQVRADIVKMVCDVTILVAPPTDAPTESPLPPFTPAPLPSVHTCAHTRARTCASLTRSPFTCWDEPFDTHARAHGMHRAGPDAAAHKSAGVGATDRRADGCAEQRAECGEHWRAEPQDSRTGILMALRQRFASIG